MEKELLRIVDAIHRERNIDKEVVFLGIESAIQSAVRKHFGAAEEVSVVIDRETGIIEAAEDGRPINPEELGRIAAQTAKQVIIQKIREAEAEMLYGEYVNMVGQLVTGTVQRFEGPNIVVNLGKTEGFMPASEQIPGENYRTGDRIRSIIIEVRKSGPKLRIVLSRRHPDLVRRFFELEVPEVNERIIDIKGIAREAGFRTKIAVSSSDPKVDCVGACVGVRGTRIKSIVDELNGEKIDIVRYNEYKEIMIMNCLKPAEIDSLVIEGEEEEGFTAAVAVREDQLSLAIGKKGRNVRLAAELAGCSIDIVPVPTATPAEGEKLLTFKEEGAAAGQAEEEITDDLGQVEFLTPSERTILKNAGYKSRLALLLAIPTRVAELPGIGKDRAEEIIALLNSEQGDKNAEGEEPGVSEEAEESIAGEPTESSDETDSGEEEPRVPGEEPTEPSDDTDSGEEPAREPQGD